MPSDESGPSADLGSPPVNIVYDQRLRDYMARKGYTAVVVEAISPTGCCADATELYTRFARPVEAAALKEKGCRVLPGEAGEVLIPTRGMNVDNEVRLGLRNFLGIKDITVKGIRAWSLR